MKKKYLITSFLSFVITVISFILISTVVYLFISSNLSNPDDDLVLFGKALYFILAIIIFLLPTLQMLYFLGIAKYVHFFFKRKKTFYIWVYAGFNIAFWLSTVVTYFYWGKGLFPFTPVINALLLTVGFLTLIFLIYCGILYAAVFGIIKTELLF
jgi:hypothetical protein